MKKMASIYFTAYFGSKIKKEIIYNNQKYLISGNIHSIHINSKKEQIYVVDITGIKNITGNEHFVPDKVLLDEKLNFIGLDLNKVF